MILSFAVIIVSGFAHFFPQYYVSELVISFLPYIIVLLFAGLVISLFFTRRYLRARRRLTVYKRYEAFGGLFALLFGILFLLFSSQFTDFYHGAGKDISGTGQIKILFANIHKDNADYTGIQNMISKNNPDVVMFVEFADHHYTHLKSFLQTNYPYTNTTTRSKTFVGSTVFSKRKIQNWADDFPQGMRRYGYFSLPVGAEDYYIYLVHTSSPDSYAHFVMRNEQLTTFGEDFQLHEKSRTDSKEVVIGDFNVTPWSVYYTQMNHVFSGKLVNATQQLPILFTRRFFAIPLLWSHIDHVWATSGAVTHIDPITVPGSDHRGFLIQIK